MRPHPPHPKKKQNNSDPKPIMQFIDWPLIMLDISHSPLHQSAVAWQDLLSGSSSPAAAHHPDRSLCRQNLRLRSHHISEAVRTSSCCSLFLLHVNRCLQPVHVLYTVCCQSACIHGIADIHVLFAVNLHALRELLAGRSCMLSGWMHLQDCCY